MTEQDAERIIRSVCRGLLNITYGNHFWDRVQERVPGFDRNDVMNVLRRGRIVAGPTWNEEFGNHRVRICGETDHGRVTLIVAIKFLDDAFAVTILPVDRG